jgi:hypothetical protein
MSITSRPEIAALILSVVVAAGVPWMRMVRPILRILHRRREKAPIEHSLLDVIGRHDHPYYRDDYYA